ncbi:MAG: AAA family ATPase [Proteobacteria bacterium]|nr:AAA family ATPase [Pseudomonadota bacterium]
MYLEYWGLKDPPFANVPDQNLFFQSNQHEEALVRLLYAVEHRKGVAMLTGEVGSGKTTISRVLVNRLPKDRFEVRTIVNPALDSLDLNRAILLELGERVDEESKTILLARLKNRLIHNAEQNLNTVLIIDEAHTIRDQSSFEELRMLLNLQSEHQFLITLIIMGQPPLKQKIFDLKPLRERIAIKYDLTPLDVKDTMRYILFRLKNAGAVRGIFTKEAVYGVYDYSGGIPLRINNVCERSMLIGMMMKATVIGKKIVHDAIEDLK